MGDHTGGPPGPNAGSSWFGTRASVPSPELRACSPPRRHLRPVGRSAERRVEARSPSRRTAPIAGSLACCLPDDSIVAVVRCARPSSIDTGRPGPAHTGVVVNLRLHRQRRSVNVLDAAPVSSGWNADRAEAVGVLDQRCPVERDGLHHRVQVTAQLASHFGDGAAVTADEHHPWLRCCGPIECAVDRSNPPRSGRAPSAGASVTSMAARVNGRRAWRSRFVRAATVAVVGKAITAPPGKLAAGRSPAWRPHHRSVDP